jgi:uncharacterized protein (DUF488 family)
VIVLHICGGVEFVFFCTHCGYLLKAKACINSVKENELIKYSKAPPPPLFLLDPFLKILVAISELLICYENLMKHASGQLNPFWKNALIPSAYVQECNAAEITSISQLDHKVSEDKNRAMKHWWI